MCWPETEAEDRMSKAPLRFDDANVVAYALSVAEKLEIEEPESYAETMRTKERKFWDNAAKEEMIFLEKNRTCDLIERLKDQKLVGCMDLQAETWYSKSGR